MISRKAADPRKQPNQSTAGVFQRLLQLSDRSLEDRDLRHRIARTFQFFADLILEVGGIADAIDQKIEEPFGGKQALRFELFDGFIADGHIGAAEMEHDIVVAALTDAFEAKSLHDVTS